MPTKKKKAKKAAPKKRAAVKRKAPAKRKKAAPKKWIKAALGVKPRRVGMGPHHKKAVRVEAAHKGALHKALHVPMGEKIPMSELHKVEHAPGKLGKQARLAVTLRKLGKGK